MVYDIRKEFGIDYDIDMLKELLFDDFLYPYKLQDTFIRCFPADIQETLKTELEEHNKLLSARVREIMSRGRIGIDYPCCPECN